jgi:hypothetical protein
MSICTNGNFDNIPPPIPVAKSVSRNLQDRTNYDFFEKVQTYNIEISTFRNMNPATAASYSYWVFTGYSQINSFNIGRMLHIQAYPNSNWDVVQQN